MPERSADSSGSDTRAPGRADSEPPGQSRRWR